MTVTVLKLSDADAYLKNISIRSIKDVRALDVDLMLVLVNGDRIIISSGAVKGWRARCRIDLNPGRQYKGPDLYGPPDP